MINGGATAAAKDKLVQLQVDIDTIDKLLENEFDSDQDEEWAKAKEAFNAMKSTAKLSRTLPQNKYTSPSTKELEHFKSHKVPM